MTVHKITSVLLLMLCLTHLGQAQVKTKPRHPICFTEVADSGYYMKNAEAFLQKRLAERGLDPMRTEFTSPYYVRVFIRIVRQDNGTLAGCTVATALQNFNEMQGQYNGHNVCFQLAGIDFINDTYLNNFNIEDSLDSVYPNYIKSHDYDVDGAITIFVHYNFLNNSGSSGNAYGIPNNFLSVARWAVNDPDIHSIFGHEMGHCLGLYHTFAQYSGAQESVTRNSSNACYNCAIGGDLCCDTPADYRTAGDYTSSTTCVYNRNLDNACDGLRYNPSTSNIMSYHPWECISFTASAITANQRTRIHATINDPFGPVFTRVADDNLALSSTTQTSNRVRIYTAKNNVTMAGGAGISHTASSQAYYAAGSSITFTAGVTFSPGTVGVVSAGISGCN